MKTDDRKFIFVYFWVFFCQQKLDAMLEADPDLEHLRGHSVLGLKKGFSSGGVKK